MSNFAFLAGGAHVNEPLGLGRCRIATGEPVQIPGRNGDDLGGGQRRRILHAKKAFAIIQPSTRRNQLKDLVHHIFRQVGREVARWNAEAQYIEASPIPRATLAEHLSEFDELWTWTAEQWYVELSDPERTQFDGRGTETERDAFRIVRSFARKAECDQTQDFPLSVEHLATALGVSHQAIGELRKRFVAFGIIEKTADHVPNRAAARFRWLLSGRVP